MASQAPIRVFHSAASIPTRHHRRPHDHASVGAAPGAQHLAVEILGPHLSFTEDDALARILLLQHLDQQIELAVQVDRDVGLPDALDGDAGGGGFSSGDATDRNELGRLCVDDRRDDLGRLHSAKSPHRG